MDDNASGAADATETTEVPTNEAGFPLVGGFPLNSRLRALALADAGEETDPDGIVTDEAIADHKAQAEAEEKAAARDAKEPPAITARTTLPKLLAIAEAEGVTIGDGDRENREAVAAAITAQRAINSEA